MSLAIVYSRAQTGMDAPLVTVEVHLSNGLPSLAIVGLPETAVKESRERVRAALINSGFDFPARRITVNLAPADLPKEGGRYDLAIALGILGASGQLDVRALDDHEFLGELALTGALRPVPGVLPAVLQTRTAKRCLITSTAGAVTAAVIAGAPVRGAEHLLQVCAHLTGAAALTQTGPEASIVRSLDVPDMADIRGQNQVRRALEVAAAGGHGVLMIGPPGTGKSSLAARFPGILPPMTEQEAIESAALASLAPGGFSPCDWRRRPFRSPHHSATPAALAGGGSIPCPGEISLAHNGVLFLDELPEFDRRALEVLRQPLESGTITVSRARLHVDYPARFQLIAAMNPCPCGYLGQKDGRCRCSSERVDRYRSRLSGPLLDRIDLHIEVPPIPYALLHGKEAPPGETSAAMRERVTAARARQLTRDGKPSHALSPGELGRSCPMTDAAAALLERAARHLHLSARAVHRVIKVARTIADLGHSNDIAPAHIAEAISYRSLDRMT